MEQLKKCTAKLREFMAAGRVESVPIRLEAMDWHLILTMCVDSQNARRKFKALQQREPDFKTLEQIRRDVVIDTLGRQLCTTIS